MPSCHFCREPISPAISGHFRPHLARFERWLLSHPTLGKSVKAWRRNRAIPRKAKLAAVTTMGTELWNHTLGSCVQPLGDICYWNGDDVVRSLHSRPASA
nr:DUF454 family protein [Rhizobium sp. R693]